MKYFNASQTENFFEKAKKNLTKIEKNFVFNLILNNNLFVIDSLTLNRCCDATSIQLFFGLLASTHTRTTNPASLPWNSDF